jgi:leucyl/phenylalanyl-tRNA--protein transferase
VESTGVGEHRAEGRSGWQFAEALARADPGEDLVAVGADLEPSTVLAAYRCGLFPMGLGEHGAPPIGWWSPDPRGILPLTGLHRSRSLRAAMRRFEIRVDTDFAAVVRGCADPDRPGAWITPQIAAAYAELHRLGRAHSVECWRDGVLVGGVYGVGIGGLFAGESMFHVPSPAGRDASKVALAALVDLLTADGVLGRLLDVQWRTPHLAGLGVIEIERPDYLARLAAALRLAEPAWRAACGS